MPVTLLPSFLGVGLSYPMRLDATLARLQGASGELLVKQSIDQIINTDIDERPFLVKNGVPFGTRTRRTLFDSVSAARDVIQYDVKRALDTWEPRIVTDLVDAQEVNQNNMHGLIVTISYRYRSTNRADNYVIPYIISSSGKGI